MIKKKNKQTKNLKPKTRKKKRKEQENKKQEKKTRRRENERKMYLEPVTCWIAYMHNVALNIKAPSTRIQIFLKPHIFFITKQPPLNSKPVNPLIHSRP